MIDFESEILTLVSSAIREDGVDITSEPIVMKPAKFPCCSIVEADNYIYRKTSDSGSIEKHVRVTYEVNVYSNLGKKRKSQCKEILSKVDKEFIELGFERITKNPISMGDGQTYRLLARYQAVLSKNGTIFRN